MRPSQYCRSDRLCLLKPTVNGAAASAFQIPGGSAFRSYALQVASRGLCKHPSRAVGKPTLEGTESPDSQRHLLALKVSHLESGLSSSHQAFRGLPLGLTSDGVAHEKPQVRITQQSAPKLLTHRNCEL